MSETFSSSELRKILIQGEVVHKWTELGTEVVFTLFDVGVNEKIQRQVSGLDMVSRRFVSDIYELAYSIKSVGGYDFDDGSVQKKLDFVRAMSRPVFDQFVYQLRIAQTRQMEIFQKIQEDLKNQPPTQL